MYCILWICNGLVEWPGKSYTKLPVVIALESQGKSWQKELPVLLIILPWLERKSYFFLRLKGKDCYLEANGTKWQLTILDGWSTALCFTTFLNFLFLIFFCFFNTSHFGPDSACPWFWGQWEARNVTLASLHLII